MIPLRGQNAPLPIGSLEGPARIGRRTKELVHRLKEGDIAVIFHRDLDAMAARSLAARKPAAVINVDPSMSGRYVNGGPRVLLNAGIPLYDAHERGWTEHLQEGQRLKLYDGFLFHGPEPLSKVTQVDAGYLEDRGETARQNLESEISAFAQNTLRYLVDEREMLFHPPTVPELSAKITGRPVLIVVRGEDYREDLQAAGPFLREQHPLVIGVDGGADALREAGFKPDIVLGDMDSVSDETLMEAPEIVVHAYADGRAPGLERVRALGREAVTFPVPGTSEDAAMLLAYEHGASLIVAVGTHFSLEDFLDKGRDGMASTFLVRLRVGRRLVDAKGVSRLYRGGLHPRYLVALLAAALLPIIVVLVLSSPLRDVLQISAMKLQFYLWKLTH